MSALIQLARALSEKFTYEELKDYLNESNQISVTLDGKTTSRPMKHSEAGLALRYFNDDPTLLIVTYPRNEPVAISTNGKEVGSLTKALRLPEFSDNADIKQKLMNASFKEFDENFAIDINDALGVKKGTFKFV